MKKYVWGYWADWDTGEILVVKLLDETRLECKLKKDQLRNKVYESVPFVKDILKKA